MASSERDAEFATFVGARARPLVRLAYLVTGDAAVAASLIREGLARTYLDWGRIDGPEAAEAHTVRAMLLSHRRSAARSRRTTEGPTEPSAEGAARAETADTHDPASAPVEQADDPSAAAADGKPTDRYAAAWAALDELPPRERAVLVLSVHERMAVEDMARTYGCLTRSVRHELTRGYDAFGRALERPREDWSEELAGALASHAGDADVPPGLAEESRFEAAGMKGQRSRRTWAVVGGLAALLLLAGVTAATLGGPSEGPLSAASPTPSSSTAGPALSASASPSAPNPLGVTVVPQQVFRMSRDNQALVAYGSVILDGPSGDRIDLDASLAVGREVGAVGTEIESLARANGGFIAVLRFLDDPNVAETPLDPVLLFVARDGTERALATLKEGQLGVAVSPDGLTVVHAVTRLSAGPGGTRSRLIVQELSGRVVDSVRVQGPVLISSLDADRVWFERAVDPRGRPSVWERRDGSVRELDVRGAVGIMSARSSELVLDLGADGCVAAFDVADVSAPRELWRECSAFPRVAIDPSGGLVALAKDDAGGRFDAYDALTGRRVYGIALRGGTPTQLEWTFEGQRTMVESVDPRDGSAIYTAVQAIDASGSTVITGATYRLPGAHVVFGRELPIPSVG